MVPRVTYVLFLFIAGFALSYIFLGPDNALTLSLAFVIAGLYIIFLKRLREEEKALRRRREAEVFTEELRRAFDELEARRKNMASNEKKDNTSH